MDDELTDARHHGDHDQREALSIIWRELDNKSYRGETLILGREKVRDAFSEDPPVLV